MHNGSIAHFDKIKREVLLAISDEALQQVKGTTDSEHFAALFFTYLDKNRRGRAWMTSQPLSDAKCAFEGAITRILEIQNQVMGRAGAQVEASSLNCVVTDGTQLLAIRFRNHSTEHPPSLYLSTRAGATLNRKYPGHPNHVEESGQGDLGDESEHGEHVIVASEPTTYKEKEWELIGKNECVMVGVNMVLSQVSLDIPL
ncbi:uncharacterized protein FIBRA_01497 [Fibroporia radiculosa]|uniref:Glutamine amidotransferase type-2 domain-containing protein n=1 Tax=Fibroporia radiculosa TaxID=599839 RepID=J4H167_9APHY|nr:uncharacterized protein FIBRA_01497 [Fibroporia radiculosa]CCL99479.1 predicted protein [Fibroporia radiculosa]